MGRQNHIASEALLSYAERQAGAEETARVRAHLETGCRLCADELASWSRIITHLEADRRDAVPEGARQRAFAILEASPPAPTLWQRIIAVLSYDSQLLAAPSPARTQVEVGASRELLYEANGIHIALLCQQIQGQWRVAGQMLSASLSDADGNRAKESNSAASAKTGNANTISTTLENTGENSIGSNWKVLATGPAGQQATDADEWNEFRLPDLRPGAYVFTLRSPQVEIVLPEVELPS